jgi:hypothetical protein
MHRAWRFVIRLFDVFKNFDERFTSKGCKNKEDSGAIGNGEFGSVLAKRLNGLAFLLTTPKLVDVVFGLLIEFSGKLVRVTEKNFARCRG